MNVINEGDNLTPFFEEGFTRLEMNEKVMKSRIKGGSVISLNRFQSVRESVIE
jgi:hypothetical protein